MHLADTDPEVRRRQLEVYRAMSAQQRVLLALALSEDLRRVALDGIRSRKPASDEADLRVEWLRMLHGDRLAVILSAADPAR